MRPISNPEHKNIDDQITDFFSRGGEVEKIDRGVSGNRKDGLTEKVKAMSQKRKKKSG